MVILPVPAIQSGMAVWNPGRFTMNDKSNTDLAKLEDDLSLLEQHAKHVVSLLGRRISSVAERVAALQASSLLFEEIRQIRDMVHNLKGNP